MVRLGLLNRDSHAIVESGDRQLLLATGRSFSETPNVVREPGSSRWWMWLSGTLFLAVAGGGIVAFVMRAAPPPRPVPTVAAPIDESAAVQQPVSAADAREVCRDLVTKHAGPNGDRPTGASTLNPGLLDNRPDAVHHWSFVKPRAAIPPPTLDAKWSR